MGGNEREGKRGGLSEGFEREGIRYFVEMRTELDDAWSIGGSGRISVVVATSIRHLHAAGIVGS